MMTQVSATISLVTPGDIRLSVIDIDFAFGQMLLSDETARCCVFAVSRGEYPGLHRFVKGLCGLCDLAVVFKMIVDGIFIRINGAAPFMDDVLIFTPNWLEGHYEKLDEDFAALEKKGLRLWLEKCDFF